MKGFGFYRIYFNRKADAPFVWSIDDGNQETEFQVKSFEISGKSYATSVYNFGKLNEETPVAWIAIWGELTVRDGKARFD